MTNAINWFEIPVTDLDRAVKFYNTIFGIEMQRMEGMGDPLAFFPGAMEDVGGALVKGEHYTPSMVGTVVYLNGGEDLSRVLDRVEAAGGKVLQPKIKIGEYGYIAFFTDTEGNRVGLHSSN